MHLPEKGMLCLSSRNTCHINFDWSVGLIVFRGNAENLICPSYGAIIAHRCAERIVVRALMVTVIRLIE